MAKPCFIIATFYCILSLSSCYIDDSSGVTPTPLPFSSFSEFFAQNNALADTLMLDETQASTVTTQGGTDLNIPENTFNAGGTASLAIKDANAKSDFIFLNKPTQVGNTIIDSKRAVFFEAFDNTGALNVENPISVTWMPNGTSTPGDLDYFYFENNWSKDEAINIQEDNDQLFFETTRAGWQLCGKVLDNTDQVQLTVTPMGYGIVPNDFKAFIVYKDRNTVLALNADLDALTATGAVPKDQDIYVVLLVMDFFRLNVGIQEIKLTADNTIEVDTDRVLPEEMIEQIKALDE